MKRSRQKAAPGLPHYDGIGGNLAISPATLRAAHEADSQLMLEEWPGSQLSAAAAADNWLPPPPPRTADLTRPK